LAGPSILHPCRLAACLLVGWHCDTQNTHTHTHSLKEEHAIKICKLEDVLAPAAPVYLMASSLHWALIIMQRYAMETALILANHLNDRFLFWATISGEVSHSTFSNVIIVLTDKRF